MIVLDEHLKGLGLEEAIGRWYPGQVVAINSLRPGSIIEDDAVPTLLRQQKQPTFVTLNWTDFWRRIPADRRYCIVCLTLSSSQVDKVPDLLRSLFQKPDFKTKTTRMGKVARVNIEQVQFYQVEHPQLFVLS